ncbi:MAG: hemolysin family protein [Deltaproteobacteria bacterium]|jgi:CBS domain containing-hemolysin-like protein|nr:hemolysin family protein [Deltaproteobacteria bacterium]
MLLLICLVVFVSVAFSFFCSLMEAIIFTVSVAFAKAEADKGNKAAKIILNFKNDVSRPISAILILNTCANTIGAAIAGSLFSKYTDNDELLVIFSIIFAFLILTMSEILPKRLGTIYNRQIALYIAYPLQCIVKVLSPIITITNKFFNLLIKNSRQDVEFTEQEFLSFSKIGVEDGVLDDLEGSVIQNIVGLDKIIVKKILTPRIVVFKLSETASISKFRTDIFNWNFTRVPIYAAGNEEDITGYIIQRDIYRALLRGEYDRQLKEFKREIYTVTDQMRVDRLFLQMFEHKTAICSVVDEHGGFAGIVTQEDIFEKIVGREIVDEYDLISNLRAYANALYKKKRGEK